MAWPPSTHFGRGRDAAALGRKGGRTLRKTSKRRTLEYTKGYAAGWVAGARYVRQQLRAMAEGVA